MLLKRDHVVNSNYSDFTAYVSACCAIYILHIHWKRTYYAVELIQTCYFRLIILKIELLSTKPPVFCQIIWSKTHKKSSVILRMNLNNLSYKTLINPPCKSIYNTYVIHNGGMCNLRKIISSIWYFHKTYLDIIMALQLGVKAFACCLLHTYIWWYYEIEMPSNFSKE